MATFKQFASLYSRLYNTKRKEEMLVKNIDAMIYESGYCIVYQASDGWVLMDIESSDIYQLNNQNIEKVLRGDTNLTGGI